MGLILDSLMLTKNPTKIAWADTFFLWLQKFKICFSQNLLFGLLTLLNSVDDIT